MAVIGHMQQTKLVSCLVNFTAHTSAFHSIMSYLQNRIDVKIQAAGPEALRRTVFFS